MSYAIDANILLYASDSGAARHDTAVEFLRAAAARSELVCIPFPVAMSYLRIATHPRIFRNPLAPGEALQNLDSLASLAHVRFLSEAEGFLAAYRDTTGTVPTRGNLVPDAHIATILRQHGVRRLFTADRDFRKFDFLEVRDPFA
ncbi:MAG TPA: TA system VapC family ribonuclease toxin [Thermoanaerobaculia bacterium]